MNISAPKSNEPLPSPDFYVNESVACNPKKKYKDKSSEIYTRNVKLITAFSKIP